jgi:hypothetical protein
MIESDVFAAVLEKQIKIAVDQSIEKYLEKIMDQLVIDPQWLAKIENRVNLSMISKFGEKLSMVDVDALMCKHIDAGIDRWQDRLKKNFSTSGITDLATQQQLTIMDDGIVMSAGVAASELLIERDATIGGTLCVQNLAVKGSVNVDNRSWGELANTVAETTLAKMTDQWRSDLVCEILTLAQTQNIDFASVTVDGEALVTGNALSPAITKSNIQKTGVLESLTVSGTVDFTDTLSVRRNRVGINTDTPEMALSVWDEEVSVIVGKFNKQHAYLGTARLQNLSIGVNRESHIEIDVDGLTTIKKLRLNQHRVSFERQVPGYSGTRGDLVFNSDPKQGQPFAWQCLGGFQWRPLRAD